MHPPVSAEKRLALRQLREREPPTFPRLAAASGLHPTTIREMASVENWEKQNFLGDIVMVATRRQDLLDEEAARERAETLEAISDPAAEVTPGDIGTLIMDEMRAILAAARRTGRIDKTRADALWSMIRAAERAENMQPWNQPGQEQETRSDDELADILARVDERIVELARDYAERLVAERLHAQAG